MYEHGLQNEESRGVGYYKLNDEEDIGDFPQHFEFDGNLERFRADEDLDQTDNQEYDIDGNEDEEEYNSNIDPSNFDYSDEFSDEYADLDNTNYDYSSEEEYDDNSHVNYHKPVPAHAHFVEKETMEQEYPKRNPKLKLSQSMMDKFYSYLSQRFRDTPKKSRTGKQISYVPESRQQSPILHFGSKKGKQKEHHHHHFNQGHEHMHKHLQKHGHEHEHVENHTYYNNHKHNHKHDHHHEHVEKNEHKQGHKHLHSHKHEHKGHGYSSHTEKLQPSRNDVDQSKGATKPTGYNNDVKAYIDEHNIKTYNGIQGFGTELDDDYIEEVHYLDTE